MTCQATIRLWKIMDVIAENAFCKDFDKIKIIKWLHTKEAVAFNYSEYNTFYLSIREAKIIVELLLLNIGSPHVSMAALRHSTLDDFEFKPVENMEVEVYSLCDESRRT